MGDSWYESVGPEDALTQGDIIVDCPLMGWTSGPISLAGGGETEVLEGAVEGIVGDVIVMTQACDLADGSVPNVIVCLATTTSQFHTEWARAERERKQSPTPRAWSKYCERIAKGFVWNLAVLNSGNSGAAQTEHRIVDFTAVYTIPRTFIDSLLRARGVQRMRLLAPYREHLSQAFARFFMRVGLPTPLDPVPAGNTDTES